MNQNVSYFERTPAAASQYHCCFKCRYEAETTGGGCPRCGKPLYSARNIRTRGLALVACGLFLTGLMSVVTILVTALLMKAADSPDSSAKIKDEAHLFFIIYLVFGGVIAAGLTALAMGIWQIAFGRRNRFLIWLFMGLITVTLTIGSFFQFLSR